MPCEHLWSYSGQDHIVFHSAFILTHTGNSWGGGGEGAQAPPYFCSLSPNMPIAMHVCAIIYCISSVTNFLLSFKGSAVFNQDTQKT